MKRTAFAAGIAAAAMLFSIPAGAAPEAAAAPAAQAPVSAAAPKMEADGAASDEFDPGKNKRLLDISSKLRCLVCQNQTIAESNADLALDLRRQVREQIAAGKTDDEIIRYMTDRYGDFVLYKPPFKASTVLLWVGPVALLVIVLGWYVVSVRRRRSQPDPESRPLTAKEREEAERLLGALRDEGGKNGEKK